MNGQQATMLVLIILLCSLTPITTLGDDTDTSIQCEIVADWNTIGQWQNSNYTTEILHRYTTIFNPPYINGTSPGGVNIVTQQIRDNEDILIPGDVTSINAGGAIDIIFNTQPNFGDTISIMVETSESSCARSIGVTNWNQPLADHEVTRETTWSLGDGQNETNQSLTFEGRGWQKRNGTLLESNELGNGSLLLDVSDGSRIITLSLDLSRVWLNETYDGLELLTQDFEMIGDGYILVSNEEGEANFSIEAQVKDAYILRSWSEQTLTERIRLEASGWLSFNDGSNNSSQGGFGEISLLYYETWDENGVRRLHDMQVEADVSVRITGFDESFSFELEDFLMREKWENGVREDQYMKMSGSGDFNFIASESPYIEVNGTIPIIHIESQGGETVSDTIIIDGTYDGDVSGTFGLVRQIVDSGAYANASGEFFEADKIQDEFWFNVSATPFGPIDQEFGAEHNLTYSYVVPQEDWDNRLIKYEYVEDNGTVEFEYPENSPTILQAESPQSNSILSSQISRETGLCPEILAIGDKFSLIGNSDLVLYVNVTDLGETDIDSHLVSIASWQGKYGDNSDASGSIVNEGPLAGLLNEIYRTVNLGVGNNSNNESIEFIEHQLIDEVLYPSILTFAENTPPSIDVTSESSVRFREGTLFTEGGKAHLEILVNDTDTDVISVKADLSSLGLGIVSLSDSGLNGDLIIKDSIWTRELVHNGLQYGDIAVPIILQDIWISIDQEVIIKVSNAAPKMLSINFSPESAFRGDTISIVVDASDGHGIESVVIDMFSSGGGLYSLNFDGVYWSGNFTVPNGLSPGERYIDIRLTDGAGQTRFTSQVYFNGQFIDAKELIIKNEPPSINNLAIFQGQNIVSKISIPDQGDVITHSLEVTIGDLDGVSSAQIKMGRLAPIGNSNVWLLLLDDGSGSDRIANDSVYTISFDARSTLSEGELNISIRATDNYLSMTPSTSQDYILNLAKVDSDKGGVSNWFQDNSLFLLLISMSIMLLLGLSGVFYLLRNSEL